IDENNRVDIGLNVRRLKANVHPNCRIVGRVLKGASEVIGWGHRDLVERSPGIVCNGNVHLIGDRISPKPEVGRIVHLFPYTYLSEVDSILKERYLRYPSDNLKWNDERIESGTGIVGDN